MGTRKRKIVVTHYRSKLADPDNLNAKAFIDAIRMFRPDILPEDNPAVVSSVTHRQEKVKRCDEKTTIEIYTEEVE